MRDRAAGAAARDGVDPAVVLARGATHRPRGALRDRTGAGARVALTRSVDRAATDARGRPPDPRRLRPRRGRTRAARTGAAAQRPRLTRVVGSGEVAHTSPATRRGCSK